MYRHGQTAARNLIRAFLTLACLSLATVHGEQPASNSLPSWLSLGGEIRGRLEGFTGLGFVEGSNDAYYLHRLRLRAGVAPKAWLRFQFEVQDARAPAHREPVTASVANSADLRQAFLELAGGGKRHWGLRVGRQELALGAERLVGPSNWGNVSRTFDSIRLFRQGEGYQLDWFVSTLVRADREHFDRFRTDVKLHGYYSSFSRWIPRSTVQPYLLWKSTPRERSERGGFGDLDVYTVGVRALGPLPGRLDYNAEAAFQRGHASSDSVRAWAGYWILGYRPSNNQRIPRFWLEYDFASGDNNPGDGRRCTFDQLYPTNHRYYGIADLIGWRNMHGIAASAGWTPRPKWNVAASYNSFWLASRQDFLYGNGGAPVVRNPGASSGHVAHELDVHVVYSAAKHIEVVLGYSHWFPGRYLKESSPGSPVTAPYVMWRYSF